MSHLLKYKEWEAPYGWHAGDTSDLAHGSNTWWYPARMLDISPADYVALLIKEFKVSKIRYFKDKNVLTFYWKNYNDCRKFIQFINKEAINRRFMI